MTEQRVQTFHACPKREKWTVQARINVVPKGTQEPQTSQSVELHKPQYSPLSHRMSQNTLVQPRGPYEHVWLYFSNSETKLQLQCFALPQFFLYSNLIPNSTDVDYDFQKCGEHVVQTDHGNMMGGQAVAFDPQEATGTQVPFSRQGCTV